MGPNVLVPIIASILLVSPAPAAKSLPYSTNGDLALSQPKTYTVQSGDTLGSIAKQVYGDSQYWTVLWQDNPSIQNPNIIFVNEKLVLRLTPPTDVGQAKLPDDMQGKLADVPPQEPAKAPQTSSVDVALVSPESAPTPPPSPTVAPSPTDQATSSAAPADTGQPSQFDDIYKAAGAKYGVPWQILYGIHMTETGGRGSSDITNHEGSGATGPMQFMPGTWRAYGVDGDGDGKADIADVTDAIYGAANYIQKHGTIMAALRSYGGNTQGTLKDAYARGLDPSQVQ